LWQRRIGFVIRKEWAVEYAEMHDPTNWLKLVVMSFPAMLREMLRAVFKRRVLSKEKEAL
jgi:hypothetical protein